MAPRPLIFLSSLTNIDKVDLVANFVKVSLAKVTGRFVSASLPNLPIVLLRYLSYGIILVNLALRRFISVDTLLMKAFLILVLCLVDRNNVVIPHLEGFSNILNVVLVLYFPAGFNLFSSVFASFTLASL